MKEKPQITALPADKLLSTAEVAEVLIEEALCFLGALGWLSFLGYTFAKAVFER